MSHLRDFSCRRPWVGHVALEHDWDLGKRFPAALQSLECIDLLRILRLKKQTNYNYANIPASQNKRRLVVIRTQVLQTKLKQKTKEYGA